MTSALPSIVVQIFERGRGSCRLKYLFLETTEEAGGDDSLLCVEQTHASVKGPDLLTSRIKSAKVHTHASRWCVLLVNVLQVLHVFLFLAPLRVCWQEEQEVKFGENVNIW